MNTIDTSSDAPTFTDDAGSQADVLVVDLLGGGHRPQYCRHLYTFATTSGRQCEITTNIARGCAAAEGELRERGIVYHRSRSEIDSIEHLLERRPQTSIVIDGEAYFRAIVTLGPRSLFALLRMDIRILLMRTAKLRLGRSLNDRFKLAVLDTMTRLLHLLTRWTVLELCSPIGRPQDGRNPRNRVFDPVEVSQVGRQNPTSEALRLNTTGKVWLLIGSISARKGVKEVLSARRELDASHTIVVAGVVHADCDEDLSAAQRDQSACRLVVVDRYLTEETMCDLICSSTAVLVPYDLSIPSGVILKAARLGVKVLVREANLSALSSEFADAYALAWPSGVSLGTLLAADSFACLETALRGPDLPTPSDFARALLDAR